MRIERFKRQPRPCRWGAVSYSPTFHVSLRQQPSGGVMRSEYPPPFDVYAHAERLAHAWCHKSSRHDAEVKEICRAASHVAPKWQRLAFRCGHALPRAAETPLFGSSRPRKTRDCWRFYVNYGYGGGWEHEVTEFTREAMRENRRRYRENSPYPLRVKFGRCKLSEEEVARAAGLRAEKPLFGARRW